MVFSSIVFLCVFLPLVFLVYGILPSMAWKNGLLIAASLVFYAYGEPVYVLLLVGSTVMNYFLGRACGAAGNRKKAFLAAAVLLNLGFLGVFKYAGFFTESLNGIFSWSLPVPVIRLPIGISFYTFQALSYVIDVYRGEAKPQTKYSHVLLYIAFFPQLIAGPIVKYHDIDKEIADRSQSAEEICRGLQRFLCGLGKKVLLSNTLAAAADALFAVPAGNLNILSAWLGAVAYMLQIYFDFSGYSDMAIGMGRMFGFHFKENFHYPYAAVSIKDFWRRWHISLSGWFKEYLYIPLGGNRKGRVRTGLNKLLVFFCTGLWHGANWTFVLWGLYHGAFLLLEEYLPVKKLPRLLGHVYTLLVVCVGFVLFRAETLSQAAGVISAMFTGFHFTQASMSILWEQLYPSLLAVLAVSVFAAAPMWAKLKENRRFQGNKGWKLAVQAGSLAVLFLCLVRLSAGTYNPFIYFRF